MSVATVTPDGASADEPGPAGTGLKQGWGVSPERQQAILDTLHGLVPRAGRLSPAQLRSVTVALAARQELWADLVVRDADVRWYLPLHRSNACDVWLLAWERGQDTDWHDHGGSSGSLTVAEGSLVERYRVPSGRRLGSRRLGTGQAIAFGPGHVDDVAHGGERSATSIHAYSPPLAAMTYYKPTSYGLIARETVTIDGPEGARGRGGADNRARRSPPRRRPSVDLRACCRLARQASTTCWPRPAAACGGYGRRPHWPRSPMAPRWSTSGRWSSGSSKARCQGRSLSAGTCWSGGSIRAAKPGFRRWPGPMPGPS